MNCEVRTNERATKHPARAARARRPRMSSVPRPVWTQRPQSSLRLRTLLATPAGAAAAGNPRQRRTAGAQPRTHACVHRGRGVLHLRAGCGRTGDVSAMTVADLLCAGFSRGGGSSAPTTNGGSSRTQFLASAPGLALSWPARLRFPAVSEDAKADSGLANST